MQQCKLTFWRGRPSQMLLRIGWAPINADPLPSTPRRNLAEVVARLDGAPIGH